MAKPKKSKKLCSGCRNERYNFGKGFVEREGIDAPVTCTQCWSFEDAKIVKKKIVSISQVPPWKNKPVWVLSCYSKPGFAVIDPNKER